LNSARGERVIHGSVRRRSLHTLAFVNQKGGCGKTTAAVHLAGALAAAGSRVLVVDLDPQAHATLALGRDWGEGASLAEVLLEDVPTARAIAEGGGGVRLLPGSPRLAEFEDEAARRIGPERVLRTALTPLAADFDHVLLDCPPRADGVLTANALRAAHTAVLVVECGAFALQGAVQAMRILSGVACDVGATFETRVLATLLDRRTRFARELMIAIHARFEQQLFETAIRSSVRLREAAAAGLPIHAMDPRSRAASDFASLAREVLELPDPSPSDAPPERADPRHGRPQPAV